MIHLCSRLAFRSADFAFSSRAPHDRARLTVVGRASRPARASSLAPLGLLAALLLVAVGCSKLNNRPLDSTDAATDRPSDASRTDGSVDLASGMLDSRESGSVDAATGSEAGGGIDSAPSSIETGQACSNDPGCKSGFCVEGVCCEARCGGACMACSAIYTGKANGTCAAVTGGLDPHDSCQASTPETCGSDGLCDGAGGCRKFGSGQSCAASSCSGATFLAARTCDGKGVCAPAISTACGTSPCTPTGCAAPCTKDTECTAVMAGSYCDAGTCKAKKANGDTCTVGNECSSGSCADGYCCNSKCDGKCQACSSKKTGQANGQCLGVPSGQDPDNECPSDATKPCGFIGCNGVDACQYKAPGTSCGNATCASSNNYTPGGSCDGAGTCSTPSAQACSNGLMCASGTACKTTCATNADCAGTSNYCTQGKCMPKKGPGTSCGAGSECGTGFCSGDGHCCNTACNGSGGCQSCTSGTCSTSSGLTVCPAANQCVNTGTDPKNCGTCGKSCSVMTSNNGVAKCSIGNCVPSCGQGYRLCANGGGMGKYSCVTATWDMEHYNHIPSSCGPSGARLGSFAHSGTTSVELTGTGDPSNTECLQVYDEACSTDPDGISAFSGATVSVWILTTATPTQCWFEFDGAANSTTPKSVPLGTWTQLSWLIPANSSPSAPSLRVRCDIADGANFYVDDISVTQP